jgi:ABC-type polysaccharide/polyol phosphate transport system ATPase subunit
MNRQGGFFGECPHLVARNIGFRYMNIHQWILRYIDLDVFPGEIVGLSGTNHLAKNILLRVVSGCERPAEGFVYCDGLPLSVNTRSPVQLLTLRASNRIGPIESFLLQSRYLIIDEEPDVSEYLHESCLSAVRSLVCESNAGLLISSQDTRFLLSICTRIVDFDRINQHVHDGSGLTRFILS